MDKNQIKQTDRICYNCKYLSWLIGVGLGLRCSHESKRKAGEMPPLVPGRFHTCELFENELESLKKK